MKLNDRQNTILKRLKNEKKVSVAELARELYVCEMTIRRDLKFLEENKLLKRYNGGAVEIESGISNIALRKFFNDDEKRLLASEAKKHLCDGITVFLDSSSTCEYLVPHLSDFRDIMLVTNSVQTLMSAAEYNIPCILTGGSYYPGDMCLVGGNARRFLENINLDIAFLSVRGYSDDGIMSDDNEAQTEIRKTVLKIADKSVFLFTNDKLHRKYIYRLCRADDVADVITPHGVNERNKKSARHS